MKWDLVTACDTPPLRNQTRPLLPWKCRMAWDWECMG